MGAKDVVASTTVVLDSPVASVSETSEGGTGVVPLKLAVGTEAVSFTKAVDVVNGKGGGVLVPMDGVTVKVSVAV